jgi:hypothetical protein
MGQLGARTISGSLAAVGCAIALVACGSSHKPNSATGSRAHPQALEFANCMRAHGVPNFPDPTGGGGGVNLEGTGIDTQSPAFKGARQACAKLTPGAVGGVQATESQFIAALRFAKCMRAHGFPAFPDPTRSDSPPGPILIVGPGLSSE